MYSRGFWKTLRREAHIAAYRAWYISQTRIDWDPSGSFIVLVESVIINARDQLLLADVITLLSSS